VAGVRPLTFVHLAREVCNMKNGLPSPNLREVISSFLVDILAATRSYHYFLF
jgi:hypothetical protein